MSSSALPASCNVEDIENQQEIHESGSEHEGTAVLVAGRDNIALIAQQVPQSKVWDPRSHRSQSAENRQRLVRKNPVQVAFEETSNRNCGHDDEEEDRSSDLPSEDEVPKPGNQPSGNQRYVTAARKLDFGRLG